MLNKVRIEPHHRSRSPQHEADIVDMYVAGGRREGHVQRSNVDLAGKGGGRLTEFEDMPVFS